jgi:FkbM family methyltransferase
MILKLKTMLKKAGLFYWLKFSMLNKAIDYLFKPGKAKAFKKELDFYKTFLAECKLIFDIGANDGHKTIVFKKLADKVIACEPDPLNLEILAARFKNNSSVITEPFALSDKTGTADFYIQEEGSPLNTINPDFKELLVADNKQRWDVAIEFSDTVLTVNTITLDTLIAKYGIPDFIKIDVEGNEKNVIKGLSAPVPCISFEVLLPEFLNDALESIDRIISLSLNTHFNYAVEEQLMLPEFIDHIAFKEMLRGLTIAHLEIIAKAG